MKGKIQVWNKPTLTLTTVHKDITDRLKEINPLLAQEVSKVLEENKAERHIRGGMATKEKYLKLNKTH